MTTRTFSSGRCSRRIATAASVSSVGTSPAARHDDVGLAVVVVRRPIPDADAARAVHDRLVDREVVQCRLLAGDDHVDVVARAEAVICDRQQAVRVGRQVDADDLGLLVHDVVDEARVLMREAVVVLAPDVRAEQVVERRDRPPPRNVARRLQPLGVLVEHRVDDVDERLVAVEEAVAAGEEVALEPALALVLGQDLHDPAVRREVLVGRLCLGVPGAFGDGEDIAKPVRRGFVRSEQAEVRGDSVDHVAQEAAEHARRLAERRPRLSTRRPRSRGSRGVRGPARSAPPFACGFALIRRSPSGRELAKLRPQSDRMRRIARPAGSCAASLRGSRDGRRSPRSPDRDLVRAPGALDLDAVDLTRAGPALRRAQDEHRPARTLADVAARALTAGSRGSRRAPRRAPRRNAGARRRAGRRDPLDEQRAPAVALEQRPSSSLGDAGEHRRVRDLVAVQMQDRQNGAVGARVEELVRVPARRERAGLRLAVADDAGDHEVGVVERSAERVRERIAELAALVDRAGRLGRDVRRDAAWERELAEELAQTVVVLARCAGRPRSTSPRGTRWRRAPGRRARGR